MQHFYYQIVGAEPMPWDRVKELDLATGLTVGIIIGAAITWAYMRLMRKIT